MRVFVNQPQFLAWAGFWNKVASADVYVMYNGVQYVDREYMNRVPISEGLDGQVSWLTLPVSREFGCNIKDVQVDPIDVHKLARRIKETFTNKSCPYGGRLGPLVEFLEAFRGTRFVDFHLWAFDLIRAALGLTTKLVVSDEVYAGTCLEKLRRCVDWNTVLYGVHTTELLCGGNTRHFNYESVFPEIKVSYQKVHQLAHPCTILWDIARSAEPLAYVQSIAEWEPR